MFVCLALALACSLASSPVRSFARSLAYSFVRSFFCSLFVFERERIFAGKHKHSLVSQCLSQHTSERARDKHRNGSSNSISSDERVNRVENPSRVHKHTRDELRLFRGREIEQHQFVGLVLRDTN